MNTFKKYWPWFVAVIFLLIYEIYSIFSISSITLSRMIWQADINFPYLKWIVLIASIILLIHFFVPYFNRLKRNDK